jgi:pyruvate ferredoxin oxidoreductase gamma subunit
LIEIRWHARGGQGGFTAARILGSAASIFGGSYAQAFPSFGPERRGAPVLGFTRIDDEPIIDHSQVYTCDFSIVLDETLIETIDVTKGLKKGGTVLINTKKKPTDFSFNKDYNVVTVNALDTALEVLGLPITNTAMMGALAAITDIIELDWLLKAIDKEMPAALAGKNKTLLEKIYEQVKEGA